MESTNSDPCNDVKSKVEFKKQTKNSNVPFYLPVLALTRYFWGDLKISRLSAYRLSHLGQKMLQYNFQPILPSPIYTYKISLWSIQTKKHCYPLHHTVSKAKNQTNMWHWEASLAIKGKQQNTHQALHMTAVTSMLIRYELCAVCAQQSKAVATFALKFRGLGYN